MTVHLGPFGPDAIEAVAVVIAAAHKTPDLEKSRTQALIALTAASAAGLMLDQTHAWKARAEAAEAERDIFREALVQCATIAGADISGGPPTWPHIGEWAVREVQQLHDDYDEAIQEHRG